MANAEAASKNGCFKTTIHVLNPFAKKVCNRAEQNQALHGPIEQVQASLRVRLYLVKCFLNFFTNIVQAI